MSVTDPPDINDRSPILVFLLSRISNFKDFLLRPVPFLFLALFGGISGSYLLTRLFTDQFFEVGNKPSATQEFVLFSAISGVAISSLIVLRGYNAGLRLVSDLRKGQSSERGSFYMLLDENYHASLAEEVRQFEQHNFNQYTIDLRRHSVAYLFLIVSAIAALAIAVSVGMGFIESMDQQPSSGDRQTGWLESGTLTALAALLSGIVSGSALKIWISTRNNLEAARDSLDRVLRYKIRMSLLLGRLERDCADFTKEIELTIKTLDVLNYDSASSKED